MATFQVLACLLVLVVDTSAGQVLRPEDVGECKPDGVTLCTKAIRAAVTQCSMHNGCTLLFEGPGTYLTQAFNLTSNIVVHLGVNATVLGTTEDRYNLNGEWPVLPWKDSPAAPESGDILQPSYQAVIYGYNLTNVTVVADRQGDLAGTLDCGGTYWICWAYPTPAAAHGFCGDPVHPTPYCLHPPCNASSGNTMLRPFCMHLIASAGINILNLTMRNSPFWNLHFQYSRSIVVDGVHIYQYPGAANADGMDIDSSSDVVVRNTMVDSNDDCLCVKSGADWLGRHNGKPSENILFENCEIRSGHGITLGSDMSAGIRNVTFRNIFYNPAASSANADPRNPGPDKGCLSGHGACPNGANIKSQRGRGGFIENILWENITGVGVAQAFTFNEEHSLSPPTNKTGTPLLRNLTVRNLHLEHVVGNDFTAPAPYRALSCASVETLSESPIQGLFLENIFVQGRCGMAFRCSALVGNDVSGRVEKLYAYGHALNVSINGQGLDSPNRCAFIGPASKRERQEIAMIV